MKNTLNLKDLLWNVVEITLNNDEAADKGVAFDMLRSNIKAGREVYPGTSGLDWAALKEQWDAMTAAERSQSRANYHLCDDFPGQFDLCKQGKREEFEQQKNAVFEAAVAAQAEGEAEDTQPQE